jgi:hypothetical protein
MAKTIQSVSIWYNGEIKIASELDARIDFDDLETIAIFSYELKEVITDEEGSISKMTLSKGSITISGQDYINWDNSNESAYEYVASKLNIIII